MPVTVSACSSTGDKYIHFPRRGLGRCRRCRYDCLNYLGARSQLMGKRIVYLDAINESSAFQKPKDATNVAVLIQYDAMRDLPLQCLGYT